MEVAGVVPKRLGLKYGPVPTLALEYEDARDARKLKLAVVELPHLTLHATPSEVAANVQKEHQLFAPSLVNEDQLVRLMQRLLQSQRDLLDKSDTREAAPEPKAGTTLSESPNTSPTKAESNNDEKELASDEEDVGEESARAASDDDTEHEPAQAPPVAESRPDKPEAQSHPVAQPRAVEDTAKDDSEFDESFEEESFVEASADKGSFLTQPPTTTRTDDDDDDDDKESTIGKFGTATARADAAVAQPAPAAAKAIDSPKDTNEKKSSKIDESADDIPSEEELEYFSGGDESGDDDGF